MEKSFHLDSGLELGLSNNGQLELLRGTITCGASLRIRVRGSSMRPFIRDNDVLTIAPLNGSDLVTGEVVAFVFPGSARLAIHRIIEHTDRGLRMRGDNALRDDGMIAAGEVLGRVIRIERAGRDVRFGLCTGRRFIARLSRYGVFWLAGGLFSLPRRVAAASGRWLQNSPWYRSISTRLRPAVDVVVAGPTDLSAVESHFGFGGLRMQHGPDVTNYVAKRGRHILGFVQYVRRSGADDPWAGHWLFSMAVRGPWRGMGIGELLAQRVIGQASAEGADALNVAVYNDNDRALALYRKAGFTQTTRPALEPEFAAEARETDRRRIIMRKILQQDRSDLRDADA